MVMKGKKLLAGALILSLAAACLAAAQAKKLQNMKH